MGLEFIGKNIKKDKPGDKISIKSKTFMSFLALVFGIIYIVLSCMLEDSQIKGAGRSVLVLVKDLCQVVVTSIAVAVIISITDLQKVYDEMKENVSNIVNLTLDKQSKCCTDIMSGIAKDYENVLEKHETKLSYLSDPQTIPYHIMSDGNLNTLIKSAVVQKTENTKMKIDSQIKELYTNYIDELQDVYVEKLLHMGKGYLNQSYSRSITIIPDDANGVLHVETYIGLNMYIPQESDKNQYTYGQRFRTEEEAHSFKITDCHLNERTVDCEKIKISKDETKNKIFPYYGGTVFDFDKGKTNTLSIKSAYNYKLGEETSFFEIYYVSDDCKNYVFEIQLSGEDVALWNVQVVWTEEKQVNNEGKSLSYDSDPNQEKANRISISTKDDRWVMKGTAINVYVRKVSEYV